MELVQPTLTEWWNWGESIALSLRREFLIGLAAGALIISLVVVSRLKELGFFGRLLIMLLLAPAIFVLGLALSQVSPVLFDPQSLARSQITPQ